jgi:DNA (cytosine-5)-methyltransferase 1
LKSTAKHKYSVVDLFAGAGGLSYGFLQTGRFEVKAAFENNRNAQMTYKKNHGDAAVYGDVSEALTNEMKRNLGQVDVVIGGPPCQGFSNANRQKNHAVSQNNSLVKKFVQTVLHLQPTAFVMENVSMLQSNIHRFYVDIHDDETIKKYGIAVTPTDIPLLDAEYLFDGVELIVANAETITHYLWDEANYLTLNIIFKTRKNTKKLTVALEKHKSKLLQLADLLIAHQVVDNHILNLGGIAGAAIRHYFENPQTDSTAEMLCKVIAAPIMIQRMLSKANEIHENEIVVSQYECSPTRGLVAKVNSMAVIDYIESILGSQSNGYTIKKGILSATSFGAPQKRMRFIIIGVKREKATNLELPVGTYTEKEFRTVKDAIGDLESVDTTSDVAKGNEGFSLSSAPTDISVLGRQLRDSEKLYNHVSTATTPEALERFKAIKPGGNFHTLSDELKTTYSDPKRTQNTIYLRLNYNEPSGTVVNVRKSMWIHPIKNRALSIREAARLQTFPDSFVFCGTKDSQYQQVGNAVPPILAKAIAEHLCKYLDIE